MLTIRSAVLSAAILTAATAATALGGPLAPPPGPPSSTGRTLTEIEPRTPLTPAAAPGDADSLYKISQPGNYYLTGDLVGVAGKKGIEVTADDVTIDLNGFTMRGAAGAKQAIGDHDDENLPHPKNLRVRNGSIVAWPQGGLLSDWIDSVRLEGLAFESNGFAGVAMSGELLATDSAFRNNAQYGLLNDGSGLVSGCVASENGSIGFSVRGMVMVDCQASRNATGFSGDETLFENCSATENTYAGFELGGAAVGRGCRAGASPFGIRLIGLSGVVEDCEVVGAFTSGVHVAASRTIVRNNRFISVGTQPIDAAIQVASGVTDVQIANNSGSNIKRGVDVDGTNCLVVGNAFGPLSAGGTLTYSLVSGNRFGPVVNAAAGGVLNAGPGGSAAGSFATTDPNANLAY